jgi:hypothetical protein
MLKGVGDEGSHLWLIAFAARVRYPDEDEVTPDVAKSVNAGRRSWHDGRRVVSGFCTLKELTYPGVIKVNVIRERRVVETAKYYREIR